MIRPGQVTMRTPTPQAVLSLPVVTPEKAVLLATSTNDADGPLARIGADTTLLTKKDTTNKAPGKYEQTGEPLIQFLSLPLYGVSAVMLTDCLLYTSPSPRD